MTDDESVRALERDVQKCKRVAAEWAGRMHDLAEERLPQHFDEIDEIARGTYAACVAWKDAVDLLQEARSGAGVTTP